MLFFSVGVGLASRYVRSYSYGDLGIDNDFCEKLALGMMFLHFVWIAILLLCHVLERPKIHTGYYIGFDLYLGLSQLTLISVLFVFSAYILGSADQVCAGSSDRKKSETCDQHVPFIRRVYITAYAFAWITSYVHHPLRLSVAQD